VTGLLSSHNLVGHNAFDVAVRFELDVPRRRCFWAFGIGFEDKRSGAFADLHLLALSELGGCSNFFFGESAVSGNNVQELDGLAWKMLAVFDTVVESFGDMEFAEPGIHLVNDVVGCGNPVFEHGDEEVDDAGSGVGRAFGRFSKSGGDQLGGLRAEFFVCVHTAPMRGSCLARAIASMAVSLRLAAPMSHMSENILRKQHTGQAGNGGEFGNHNRPESDIMLAERDADQEFTLRKSYENGIQQIANDQTDPPPVKTDFGFTHTIKMGGITHANIRARAIGSMFDADAAKEGVRELIESGKKVTLLTQNPRGTVHAHEGTGANTVGGLLLMKKGSRTRGYTFDKMNILSSAEGYGKGEQLLAQYTAAADHVPVVDEATFAGIPDTTDSEDEPPNDIAAMYLIDGPDFGEGSAPGCLFAATDVQAEDGIINGYFWAPDGSGVFSEHGSMYFDDMKQRGARVRHYRPGALTFSDVMSDSLGTSRSEAYSAVKAASN